MASKSAPTTRTTRFLLGKVAELASFSDRIQCRSANQINTFLSLFLLVMVFHQSNTKILTLTELGTDLDWRWVRKKWQDRGRRNCCQDTLCGKKFTSNKRKKIKTKKWENIWHTELHNDMHVFCVSVHVCVSVCSMVVSGRDSSFSTGNRKYPWKKDSLTHQYSRNSWKCEGLRGADKSKTRCFFILVTMSRFMLVSTTSPLACPLTLFTQTYFLILIHWTYIRGTVL